MALHVQITRRGCQLRISGQWESRLPLFQNYTLKVKEGETSAETVELSMLENGYVASWLWDTDTKYGEPALHGQFVREGSHKEVTDSLARMYDLKLLHGGNQSEVQRP
jgi:hypothetical protein